MKMFPGCKGTVVSHAHGHNDREQKVIDILM